MATEPGIGILRRCRRCDQWKSIDAFTPGARLCGLCCTTRSKPSHRIARMRGIVVTAKGRAYLAAERVMAA